VFEEVCEAGTADLLVAGADSVQHLYAGQREGGLFEDDELEAVFELEALCPGEIKGGHWQRDETEEREQAHHRRSAS
jgi:hypothetical protein